MRHCLVALACVLCLLGGAQPATAQETGQTGQTVLAIPILLIDSERLYAESDFGKRVLEEIEAESAFLRAENRRIEAELSEEERALTEQRKTMSPEDFRAVADAFDRRVQDIRRVQDGKAADVLRLAEQERLRFSASLAPVFEQLIIEANALLIMEKRTAIISRDVLDVTDQALIRANRVLGDGREAGDTISEPADPLSDE